MPARARIPRSAKPLIRAQDDPGWFTREVLGAFVWSRQLDVLESVRDNRKTAVRSGHGVGKTFTAADAALWFLYSFPNSRVITTATIWSQVRDLLWHEINKLHGRAAYDLGGSCLQTRLYLHDGRYAVGLSPKIGQEEAFQGHHAPNLLLIFDEASGIRQPLYEAGEGYMTTEGARWLLIGNPTRPEGEFYSAFHSKRDEYALHHISVLDSPNLTGEEIPDEVAIHLTSRQWVTEREKWKGTSLWDIRVAGNFPSQADDAVISLAAVEEAQLREIKVSPADQHVLSIDVARFGTDETVLVHRHGRKVRIAHKAIGQATTETEGRAIKLAREIGGKVRVVVDDVGVGGGVTDHLREAGLKVTPFNGGNTAYDEEEYPNRRSEIWFDGAGELPTLDLDGDEQLAADLVAPRYKIDSRGRRVVEPKDDTKKRLGRSPDRADAVLMSFASSRGGKVEVW